MPYIVKKDRVEYDDAIDSLATELNSLCHDDLAGHLNYIIFCLAKILCSDDYGGKRNYARMAVVSSALSEAQAEFRRRVMAPYEDEKIELNGDVEL